MTKLKFIQKFLLLLFLLCAIVTEVGARTVYFLKPDAWEPVENSVEIWVWGASNTSQNPNKAFTMSRVYDRKWQTVNIPDDYTMIAFYDPNNREGRTFNDLTINSGNTVYYDGNSQKWLDTQPLYFRTDKSWSVYNACIWGLGTGNDLDVKMSPVSGKTGLYYCEIPTSTTGTIFHNDNNWNGENEVSANNTINTYFIDGKGWMTNGTYKIVGPEGWDASNGISMTFNPKTLTFEYTIPNNNSYGIFKFIVSGGVWKGKKVEINETCEWQDITDAAGEDISINASSSTRVIEIDPANDKFRVYYYDLQKIYYYNAKNISPVKVHCWGAGLPDQDVNLTNTGVAGWMECEIRDYLTDIVFKTGDNNITSDLKLPKSNGIQTPVIPMYVDSSAGTGAWAYQLVGIADTDWHALTQWTIEDGGLLSYLMPSNKTEFKFYKRGVNSDSSDDSWHTYTENGGKVTNYNNWLSIGGTGDNTVVPNDHGVRKVWYNAATNQFKVEIIDVTESPDPTYPNADTFGPEDVYPVYSDYYRHNGDFDGLGSQLWIGSVKSAFKDVKFGTDTDNKYIYWAGTSWGGINFNDWHTWNVPDVYDRLTVYVYSDVTTNIRVELALAGDRTYLNKYVDNVSGGQWTPITFELTADQRANINSLNVGSGSETTNIAIDNIYFWRSDYATHTPATVDNDPKGLNWNTSTGATCFTNRVLYSWIDGNDATNKVYIGDANDAHDGDVNTSSDTKRGVDEGYYVIQLGHKIEVSDVELVWGNGFPKVYNVYLTDEWPLKNGQLDPSVVTETKKLYGRTNLDIDYAPYYDIESNLSEKSGRFVVVEMKERGNTFFSYALKEVNVGELTSDYNTATGLGMDYQFIHTGADNVVTVSPYVVNSRNAHIAGLLGNVTITPKLGDDVVPYVDIKNNGNGSYDIWASAPGDYTLDLAGDGKTGNSYLTAAQSWTTDAAEAKAKNYKYSILTNNSKVKIAVSHIEESNEYVLRANPGDWSKYEMSEYTQAKLVDGKEADDDDHSRWCSGSSYTQEIWPNNIKSDNSQNAEGPEWALIDMGDVYTIQDLEIIWEQAYAKAYDVYGFKELSQLDITGITNATDITSLNFTKERLTNETDQRKALRTYSNDTYKIYGKTGIEAASVFPMNDINSTIATQGIPSTMDAGKSKEVRYLLVKMTDRGTDFGYSIWEIYAGGLLADETKALTKLDAPDMKVIKGYSKLQTVTASGTDGAEDVVIENFRPVDFTLYTDEACTQLVTEPTTKLTIEDRTDGTFLVTGKALGTYYVKMEGKNGNGNTIGGTFKVEVTNTKQPMELRGGNKDVREQVYDDGYYDETVLKKNASRVTTVIDLRNVDFSNKYMPEQRADHDGALSETEINEGKVTWAEYEAGNLMGTTLPAPYSINAETGANAHDKMNPNVIYYTTDPASSSDSGHKVKTGAHVAKMNDQGVWHIHTLYIWDGWDFAPKTEGGAVVNYTLRFYTSLTANKYSFLVLPFVPDTDFLNKTQLDLYVPNSYNLQTNEMEIEKPDKYGSDYVGAPYIISTKKSGYEQTPGKDYTVYIQAPAGENSLACVPRTTTVTSLNEDANFDFIGTYTRVKAPQATENELYFWFDGDHNEFKYVGENHTVEPFYAYMKGYAKTVPAKAMSGMKFAVADETITSVNNLESNVNADGIYTINGIKVADSSETFSNLPKGMYIVNGKKIVK